MSSSDLCGFVQAFARILPEMILRLKPLISPLYSFSFFLLSCYLFSLFYPLLLIRMLLVFFLFQWPTEPHPGFWWYFRGTSPFHPHCLSPGAGGPPLGKRTPTYHFMVLSGAAMPLPTCPAPLFWNVFMPRAVLTKVQLFFFQRVGGRKGERERIKCICSKGFGTVGPQTVDHI